MELFCIALLAVTLANPDLLRSNSTHMRSVAQEDPYYRRGFNDLPYVSFNRHGNVDYAMYYHDNFTLVVMPGSQNMRDWLSPRKGNLRFWRTRKMNGMIHKGFWTQVDTYYQRMVERIPDKPVVFAGHSRGGACSTIAALRFIDEFDAKRVLALTTFGQPKCLDGTLAKQLDEQLGKRYVRVVSSTDIVPLTPGNRRYKHAGQQWFYDRNGTLFINPTQITIRKAVRRDNSVMKQQKIVSRVMNLIAQASEFWDGHSLDYYLELLVGSWWRFKRDLYWDQDLDD